MSKIKNPISFSDCFNVDTEDMNKYGIFNPMLNVDTKLFIDPLLLKRSHYGIISTDAVQQYSERFKNIILLLSNSTVEGDITWKNALRLIPQKEVEGTCLGYGGNTISGRSLTEKTRRIIIQTASEIIKVGIKDPDLFMLLPLFEEGIGPDSISDITASSIEDALLDFTYEIAVKLSIKTEKVLYKDKEREIIRNPLKKRLSPIILVPKDILRHLPVVSSWDEISDAAMFNASLRSRVNQMISYIWKAKTQEERQRRKSQILHNSDSLKQLLSVFKEGIVVPYNFEKDDLGIVSWHNILLTISNDYPLSIGCINNSEIGLKTLVINIIEQFKFLIEEKGLNKLLWKDKNCPNVEKVVQLLFFSVAYSYCKANDIDISPEMDTGIGYVDFKFSKGFQKRVIVEIKNSYNQNIISGFNKQLNLYKISEETCFGYYIIVDVGNLGRKYHNLLTTLNSDKEKKAEIIYIDGQLKPTASKRK